ncbi:MAG TPA: VOC family protein [Mycobacteriales bacterium]|nr:VOC family protein [Mycobacteriales bacterium]
MVHVTTPQPNGTPVWIDLGIPDLEKAMAFYGAVLGWTFEVGPAEVGHYTMCLLDGKRVAALAPNADQGATDFWWNMYFATDDCDGTAKRIADAGGAVVQEPMDIPEQGRLALATDPTGAQFGLWQAYSFAGAEIVNEPNSLLRNDLVTPTPGPARAFYAAVFDFTLDADPKTPELDFTFLRRPDGHEIGGILGEPAAATSRWGTLFLVNDADDAAAAAIAAGGTAADPADFIYGRLAEVKDPFGTVFSVGSAPKTA